MPDSSRKPPCVRKRGCLAPEIFDTWIDRNIGDARIAFVWGGIPKAASGRDDGIEIVFFEFEPDAYDFFMWRCAVRKNHHYLICERDRRQRANDNRTGDACLELRRARGT